VRTERHPSGLSSESVGSRSMPIMNMTKCEETPDLCSMTGPAEKRAGG
jgi:hypothetical protein